MGRQTDISDRTIRLDALYDEWEHVASHGATRPLWTDGKELNFIRKKIGLYMEELKEDGFGEITEGRELPALMDDGYMRDADGIMEQAEKTLALYTKNEDYRYLAETIPFFSRAEASCLKTEPGKLLEEIGKFGEAVRCRNPVHCRKFSDTEKYLALFGKCREETEINAEGLVPFRVTRPGQA